MKFLGKVGNGPITEEEEEEFIRQVLQQ